MGRIDDRIAVRLAVARGGARRPVPRAAAAAADPLRARGVAAVRRALAGGPVLPAHRRVRGAPSARELGQPDELLAGAAAEEGGREDREDHKKERRRSGKHVPEATMSSVHDGRA